MSLISEINNTCKAAFFYIHNIRRIRKYLSLNATLTLVHALIMGRIDYCNGLLYGLSTNLLCKLQRVQNAATRLVTGTPRVSHITPVLLSLRWLPVKERIHYKIIIFAFKVIHGLAPSYISGLLSVQSPSSYSLRRNDELLLKPFFRRTKKTLGDRAFAVAAPSLFNALPRHIRHQNNFNRIKSLVKTFLFQSTYEQVLL